ncbi:DUF917 domain-containing protein [Cellulomonas sp. GbtcB1]|uniref:DUF917 domain-containing protein n=1 Tax=Cellulomonas sp. GbtcB1 TaxID=2824746 RepID=UPI001C308FB9|nr:DUF917 domain-containing protein [Cellulomonas sp. GbtcB1]
MSVFSPIQTIDAESVGALGRGCAVLSTGGGGGVETGLLAAGHALEQYGPVEVVQPGDVAPDALVVPLSGIGAPTVSAEMIPDADDVLRLRDAVEELTGREVAAVMSSEIGGSNGVQPVAWAARLGVPLGAADGMGRAFPEVQMISMYVAGLPVNSIVLADTLGNVTTMKPVDGLWAERLARAVAVAAGSHALMADYLLDGAQLDGAVIPGTVSQAVRLGHATEGAEDPLAALVEALDARVLVTGKIIDIERRTGGGFVRGSVVIDGLGDDRGRLVRVEIQNENLVVLDEGTLLASVPDLITVVDTASARAIQTENLRYGQRVSVLAWACHPLWRSERGLEVVGPRAFGYDLDYVPVEEIGAVRG